MRYTPTLKLSTRLVAFVTMIVIVAMFILFVGGALSFQRLGQEYLKHQLENVAKVVDQEFAKPDATESIPIWLPKLLQASGIEEMTLSTEQGVIYHYSEHQTRVPAHQLYETTMSLVHHPEYQMRIVAIPPYFGLRYSVDGLLSISLAVLLVMFCVWRGLQWLKQQLYGSELLEERGRMILAGRVEQYAKGDEREWPYTASEALDRLIEELRDARQERSRFDSFIRTQTFLDKLTGSANRVLFDSKLEAALHESGARGAVMRVRIKDWSLVEEAQPRDARDQFIVEVGRLLSNLVQRFPDVVFSRYYRSDFAIMVPQIGAKELALLASQCLRQLDRLAPIAPLEAHNWCHIGITTYREGEPHSVIVEEAESALRAAELQNSNHWSRYNKTEHDKEARGRVKWRTIFESVFRQQQILLYAQDCFLFHDGQASRLHRELTCRLPDPELGVLKASRFILPLRQVGLEKQLDMAVLVQFFSFLRQQSNFACNYSLNLEVSPFAQREYFKWLRDELLQLTIEARESISFEFSEGHLVRHLDYMRPVIRMLRGLGCAVVVGQAGRTIVSTHYIKDLQIDYLKLHRSLIKRIEQRHENQLFVRSMLGAGADTQVKIIAVGVETEREWQTLLELGVHGGQGRYFSAEEPLFPLIAANSQVRIGRRNRWRKK
ncbi:RNase E specificity factor CsrD [Vibrio sp. SM6]|uniref:RNase E specificity factor CsrD n=1 Tax=Vibrio agarilyticus TaxID=2726741 RepID=A0A7X8TTG5_9VIBR|nr:RNase E specificity factor CsrD [Vibrio agarilyticus]NLS14592.1 RNase E specificity factor CsrD [Vibrio agarilyticus]